jgi:serine/threonine protein phosphatase PrpC
LKAGFGMIVASKVEAAARTDIGLVRRNNQDSFGVDEELGLYVVCDGMGGAAGGDIASKIAVETFLAVVRQELETLGDNQESTRCSLLRAGAAANRAVHSRANFDIALRGMGSTLVAARLVGESLTVLNVGDSRAYLFQSGKTFQLTDDHSYVAEQVRRGLMTEAEAERSPLGSVITRAIGADADVTPDLYEATLHPGESVLLTSDGLTRHVAAAELAEIVADTAEDTPEAACERMIELAKSRGGSDNITCIVIRAAAAH